MKDTCAVVLVYLLKEGQTELFHVNQCYHPLWKLPSYSRSSSSLNSHNSYKRKLIESVNILIGFIKR